MSAQPTFIQAAASVTKGGKDGVMLLLRNAPVLTWALWTTAGAVIQAVIARLHMCTNFERVELPH